MKILADVLKSVICNRNAKLSEARKILVSQATDAIEALVNTPIPERLWQNTDFDGFQGIVKSMCVYAENIKRLNDREEFIHALILAKEMLDRTGQDRSGTTRVSRGESWKSYAP